MSIRRKTALALAIMLLIVILYNLGWQLINSLQADKRLDVEVDNLTRLQKKNADLRKQFTEVQSISFIEQQARDKLNLARPNETVIIIPQKEIDRILGEAKKAEEIILPNYQGWLKLFLH